MDTVFRSNGEIDRTSANGTCRRRLRTLKTRLLTRPPEQYPALEIAEAGERANIIEDYPDDKYSPSCLLLGFTRAGRHLHMQVSLADTDLVKIVTLYEPDGGEWVDYSVRSSNV